MTDNLVNDILSKKRDTINNNMNYINNQIISIVNEIYRPYELFKNNVDNKKKTLEDLLNSYQYYVPSDNFLVSGDYVRYITKNTKIGNNIYLKLGGFLLDEDKYNIRITNNNRIMKISKKDNYIFRKLTKNDIFRISISENFS
jgi:hypothetical protein